jgi:hypothetical protein
MCHWRCASIQMTRRSPLAISGQAAAKAVPRCILLLAMVMWAWHQPAITQGASVVLVRATAHGDKEFENWAKWINGEANDKLLDPSVFRTVQPNYTAAPILKDDVIDPVPENRYGVFVGETNEVQISIPTEKWEDHVRQQERDEHDELVEYDLRKPYVASEHLKIHGDERYLDHMARIGDDLDGFHDPMTRAIMYWAIDGEPADDAAFKDALRTVVRTAKCTKQRDLDYYCGDHYLDGSLRGARAKVGTRNNRSREEWWRNRNQASVTAQQQNDAIQAMRKAAGNQH